MLNRPVLSLSTLALTALSLAALTGCPKSASPPSEKGASGKLNGSYEIVEARNVKGNPYTGSVKIKQQHDRYLIDWTVGGGEKYGGVAIERGNVLGVGWGTSGSYGVVVYRIDGGKLDGLWATNDNAKLGSEILSGGEGLSGSYKIASSYSPVTKGSYRGTVDISRIGDAYKLVWSLNSGESYDGLGMKQGDYLVVAWPKSAAGVVAYDIDGDVLDGIWSSWSGEPGVEKIAKK